VRNRPNPAVPVTFRPPDICWLRPEALYLRWMLGKQSAMHLAHSGRGAHRRMRLTNPAVWVSQPTYRPFGEEASKLIGRVCRRTIGSSHTTASTKLILPATKRRAHRLPLRTLSNNRAQCSPKACAINSYDRRRSAWSCIIVVIIISSTPHCPASSPTRSRTDDGEPMNVRCRL
jgi:hypothetical protein